MPVYIDALVCWSGRRWCHMFTDDADSPELHAMAARIGLKPEWFQGNHYDLMATKRALAIRFGAIEVDRRQTTEIFRKQRGQR